METGGAAREDRDYILAFVLLAVPFYINGVANLYITDWRRRLLVDYAGVKLFPLPVAAWLRIRRMTSPHGSRRYPGGPSRKSSDSERTISIERGDMHSKGP